MKPIFFILFVLFCTACNTKSTTTETSTTTPPPSGGQETVKDEESEKDIVKVAVDSPDHTTLVKALQQADLVTSMSNAGPFTVFAPTNAAFNAVDKATLENLMKDENKKALMNILEYHVTLSSRKADSFKDGDVVWMANGDNVSISVKGDKVVINDSATIIASVKASNGMIHVIDAVLLPPSK